MSQPPPFPPLGAQGEPIPVQPIPYTPPFATAVSALPPMAPIPAESLPYGTPIARRPGLLTAIGIMSIIVGSLTVLSTAVQGVQTLVMFAYAQTSATMTRINTQMASAAQVAATPVPASEDGFADVDERETVLTGLTRARVLPPERRRQLDALLLDGGKEMFLLRGPQLTAQAIQSNVSDSGRKFADDGDGAEFYIVGQGEIEVYDDHAVFYPSDGGEMISASAEVSEEPAVEPEADGSGIASSSVETTSSIAITPTPGPTTMPAAPAAGPRINKPALAVLMIERLLSLGLAVYLFVIGILVLRQSPRGRRLHHVYAFAKIPLALVGGWATWKLWMSFFSGFGPGSIATAWTPWIVAVTVLACAYPIALLIVLRSRTVREYYA